MRQFDEIDDGGWFPAKYDRRHDLSVVLQYQLSERVNIGGVFIYTTGNSLTLPERRWFSLEENRLITVWSDRNAYRLDPYHRMDLSVTVDAKSTKKQVDKDSGKK